MDDRSEVIAGRLTQLGFSQYEARTYIGLLLSNGATGYSVANDTGVPQPKVYETLRRLVERGAAVRTGEKPARYTAIQPDILLKSLEADFATRVAAARRDLETLPNRVVPAELLPVTRVVTFDAAVQSAVAAISRARTRIYMSGKRDELTGLGTAVTAASDAGVEFVMVHFGRLPFRSPRGRVTRHASTDGTLYRSRLARHLAVVVDSQWSLWGVAKDGKNWDILTSESPLLAGLVKAYIRHDMFVQQIFADFPAELEARYGSGLLDLASLSPTVEPSGADQLEGAG
jgi:HTH-type transcriptional regulator, sugar sensing transcriptional regulator